MILDSVECRYQTRTIVRRPITGRCCNRYKAIWTVQRTVAYRWADVALCHGHRPAAHSETRHSSPSFTVPVQSPPHIGLYPGDFAGQISELLLRHAPKPAQIETLSFIVSWLTWRACTCVCVHGLSENANSAAASSTESRLFIEHRVVKLRRGGALITWRVQRG